jgi:gas vesicle protein
MNNKDVAIGFAVGLGIGAILGVVLAPQSGEETRQMLAEKTEDFSSNFDKLMFNLRWLVMTPRERYAHLWKHGGSLRELRKDQECAKGL